MTPLPIWDSTQGILVRSTNWRSMLEVILRLAPAPITSSGCLETCAHARQEGSEAYSTLIQWSLPRHESSSVQCTSNACQQCLQGDRKCDRDNTSFPCLHTSAGLKQAPTRIISTALLMAFSSGMGRLTLSLLYSTASSSGTCSQQWQYFAHNEAATAMSCTDGSSYWHKLSLIP